MVFITGFDLEFLQIKGKWENGRLHGPVKICYPGYDYIGKYNNGLVS